MPISLYLREFYGPNYIFLYIYNAIMEMRIKFSLITMLVYKIFYFKEIIHICNSETFRLINITSIHKTYYFVEKHTNVISFDDYFTLYKKCNNKIFIFKLE